MSDSKQPSHRAYYLIPRPTTEEPDKKFWFRAGSVFPHKGGLEAGFDILLDVLPRPDLRIVCTALKDEEPEPQPEPQRKSWKK